MDEQQFGVWIAVGAVALALAVVFGLARLIQQRVNRKMMPKSMTFVPWLCIGAGAVGALISWTMWGGDTAGCTTCWLWGPLIIYGLIRLAISPRALASRAEQENGSLRAEQSRLQDELKESQEKVIVLERQLPAPKEDSKS